MAETKTTKRGLPADKIIVRIKKRIEDEKKED